MVMSFVFICGCCIFWKLWKFNYKICKVSIIMLHLFLFFFKKHWKNDLLIWGWNRILLFINKRNAWILNPFLYDWEKVYAIACVQNIQLILKVTFYKFPIKERKKKGLVHLQNKMYVFGNLLSAVHVSWEMFI